jgi:hypothetical protein
MESITSVSLLTGSGIFLAWLLYFSIKQCLKSGEEEAKKLRVDRIYYETYN